MRMSLRLVRKPHMKNRAVAIDIARRSVLFSTVLRVGMSAVVVIAMPECSSFGSCYRKVTAMYPCRQDNGELQNIRHFPVSLTPFPYLRLFPIVRIEGGRLGMSVVRG